MHHLPVMTSAAAARGCAPGRGTASAAGRAFTLVEMIVVMVLVALLAGLASPALRTFMRGRETVSEARRFLALTRYASSQAVSTGLVLELWLDPAQGAYGLYGSDVVPGRTVAERVYALSGAVHLGVEQAGEASDDACTVMCLPDGTLVLGDLTAVWFASDIGHADPIVWVPDPWSRSFVAAAEAEWLE